MAAWVEFLPSHWAGADHFTGTCHPDNARALGFYRKTGGRIVDRDLSNEEA